MREQFTFYRSFWESIQVLDTASQMAIIVAIIEYALDEKEPDLQGVPAAMFKLIRPNLDAANKKSKAGKSKSHENQTRNRTKSKTNQNEIKTESNKNQTRNKNKGEGEIEIEKESYKDSFSIEKESNTAPPAPTTKGGAERRWGTYDPEDDKREIVYKEFGSG